MANRFNLPTLATIRGLIICATNNERFCPSQNTTRKIRIKQLENPKPQAELVISVALWGTDRERYLNPLLQHIGQVRAKHPTWTFRVHVSPDLHSTWLTALREADVEIAIMTENNEGHQGATWAYLPLAEERPMIVWGADDMYDSSFMSLVERWLQTNKQFMMIVAGCSYFQPLRGCFGAARNKPLPNIAEQLEQFNKTCNCYGCDEVFLSRTLHRLMTSDNTLVVADSIYKVLWLPLIVAVVFVVMVLIYVYYSK